MNKFMDLSGVRHLMERIKPHLIERNHLHATSDVNDLPVGAVISSVWVDDVMYDASTNVWLRCNGQPYDPEKYPDMVGLVPGNIVPNITTDNGMNHYIKATDFRVSPKYPIGWLKVLSTIDLEIYAHQGAWLRCDGREVSIEEYPDLIGLGGVLPPVTVFWDATEQMSSNLSPSPYVASASSIFSATYDAYRAFGKEPRDTTQDAWVSKLNTYDLATGNVKNTTGEYVQVKLPKPALLTKYAFHSRNTPITTGESSVRDFQLMGSEDGSLWEIVDSKISIPRALLSYQRYEYMVYPDKAYQYYRFNITRITVGDKSRSYVGVADLYLYETADLPPRITLPNIPLVDGKYTYIFSKYARIIGDGE